MLIYFSMYDEKRKKLIRMKATILSIIYLFSCLFVNSFSSKKERYFSYVKNSSYEEGCILEYATYNNRNIYIVDKEIYASIDKKDNDIYCIDCRDSLNPTVQICDSYKIVDEEEMFNILGVIVEYEKEFPSKWNRSLDAMYIEWYIHNLCYEFNILKDRSENVDIDNRDALIYENEILEKLLVK